MVAKSYRSEGGPTIVSAVKLAEVVLSKCLGADISQSQEVENSARSIYSSQGNSASELPEISKSSYVKGIQSAKVVSQAVKDTLVNAQEVDQKDFTTSLKNERADVPPRTRE